MTIRQSRHTFATLLLLSTMVCHAGIPWNPFKKKAKKDSIKSEIITSQKCNNEFLDSAAVIGIVDNAIAMKVNPWQNDFRIPPLDTLEFCGEKISMSRYDLRERLDRELLAFQYGHTNTMLTIKRANRLFPIIEPILAENKIPDDFKYLMCIESSCNIFARSTVGACGLWQIMEATAKEHGLTVNEMVDERYDIEKSTKAACDYFHKAYDKYHDWLTVAASYNAGMARITQQLERQQCKTALDLHINEETSRYMFRILVMKKFFENPKEFGFKIRNIDLYPPMEYTEEYVSEMDNWADFALGQGINYSDLRQANPWIRNIYLKQEKKSSSSAKKNRHNKQSRSKKSRSRNRKSRHSKKLDDVSDVTSSTSESVSTITAEVDTTSNPSAKKYKVLIPTRESIYYNPQKTKAHNKNWITE